MFLHELFSQLHEYKCTLSTPDVVVPQSCQGEETAVLEELPAIDICTANCRENLHCKGLSYVLITVFMQVIKTFLWLAVHCFDIPHRTWFLLNHFETFQSPFSLCSFSALTRLGHLIRKNPSPYDLYCVGGT